MAPPRIAKPQAVLFACGLNSIRSPMAMALFRQMFGKKIYVGSAGVRTGELDPFAVAVMEEIGIDIGKHKPQTFEQLDEWEGLEFRPDRHAVAGGASQGAGADAHARRRSGILADAGSERCRRQPRADARRLSRCARPADRAGSSSGSRRRARGMSEGRSREGAARFSSARPGVQRRQHALGRERNGAQPRAGGVEHRIGERRADRGAGGFARPERRLRSAGRSARSRASAHPRSAGSDSSTSRR